MTIILPSKHDDYPTLPPTKEEILELRDKAKVFLELIDRYCCARDDAGDEEYLTGPGCFLNNLIWLNDDDTVSLQWDDGTEEHETLDAGHHEVTFPLSDFWTLTKEALEKEVAAKQERKAVLAEEARQRLERYRQENEKKIELATLKRLQKKYKK